MTVPKTSPSLTLSLSLSLSHFLVLVLDLDLEGALVSNSGPPNFGFVSLWFGLV